MCYLDREPHYNPGLSLFNLTVGNPTWKYVSSGQNTDKYGHLANGAKYFASTGNFSEIYFKISIKTVGSVMILGWNIETAIYYIDEHVSDNSLAQYVAPAINDRKWANATLVLTSIMEISSLSVGDHVLIICANETSKLEGQTSVSHIFMWE